VSIFGAMAGILAGWFTGETSQDRDRDLEQLTAEIASLRRSVEAVRSQPRPAAEDRLAA
jgi:hypothetical protein